MVSNFHLAIRLRQLLLTADYNTTTASTLRRQLEESFGVDLSDRKAFIRQEIDGFLRQYVFQTEARNEPIKENERAGADEPEQADNAKENGGVSEEKVEEKEENGGVSEEKVEEKEENGGEGRKERNKQQSCQVKSNEGIEGIKKMWGFNTLFSLSPQLQNIVGATELSRPEVVKKLWVYIRDNRLQDPKNGRNIICDELLYALFHVNSINMFRMNKALSKHIWPLNVENEIVKQKRRLRRKEESSSESEGDYEDEEYEEDEEWGEEEIENEEDDSNRRGSKKRGRPREVNNAIKKKVGFSKVCALSPELQKVVGESELARAEVVKKLWSYIRENNLQDPKDRRIIICDETLHALFHVDSLHMYQMNKALSKYIWPLDVEDDASAKSAQREKRGEERKDKGQEEAMKKEKRHKGLFAAFSLSDALMKFLGTGESVSSRPDVIKRMWEYIKRNKLQDPSNKRRILCDSKLKELFEVDTFIGFSVAKLLNPHFIKREQ